MSKAPYPCAPTKNLSPGRGRIEPTNNGGAVSLCTHEEPVTAGDRQRSLGPSLRRPQQSPAVGWNFSRKAKPRSGRRSVVQSNRPLLVSRQDEYPIPLLSSK